jgi:TnpA family transposase
VPPNAKPLTSLTDCSITRVIKSDIHSTDTHGYTEIIFGVTYLLGLTFAPRLKQLDRQRLYSFQKRKMYETQNFRILPDAYIDTKLIAENWSDILRFVATIKLKYATASQLFKRLNSYSKQHPHNLSIEGIRENHQNDLYFALY